MTSKEIYKLFTQGTRVKVVRNEGSYRRSSHVGKFGVVNENLYYCYGKIAVLLDNEKNPQGHCGYFYFKPSELALVDDDDNILEDNTMQNVVNYFNIAKIKYLDSDRPSSHFYANFDISLKEGDFCMVKSLHHGYGLAIVTEILNQNDIQTPREIVAKVDTEAYDNREKSRKLAAELKAKMQERAKQLQDIALYQMLAKEDSEMQELLNSYQNLPLF